MSTPILQVWQQRLECEEADRQQLQTRFDQTVASMQQSAAATTLLLQKHAATMSMSALDLEASGTLELLEISTDCLLTCTACCGRGDKPRTAQVWQSHQPLRLVMPTCACTQQDKKGVPASVFNTWS